MTTRPVNRRLSSPPMAARGSDDLSGMWFAQAIVIARHHQSPGATMHPTQSFMMPRPIFGFSGLALLLALAGCGSPLEEDPETTTTVANALYGNASTLWPGHPAMIPVCWENPTASNQQQRAWIEAAIRGQWGRYGRIAFTGWG